MAHTNYNQVYEQVTRAANEAVRVANCQVADLCIDITGGQKVYTSAATVVTLNRDARFSYVGTIGDKEEGKVITYDDQITS